MAEETPVDQAAASEQSDSEAGAETAATAPTAASVPRPRRRASRAAGPTGEAVTIAEPLPESSDAETVRITPPRTPHRRVANRQGVSIVAAASLLVAIIALGAVVGVLSAQHRGAERAAAREQRFVDVAEQTVINMFSYTDQTVEESVDRFVAGTSGPLRDMMAGNADNLKQLFRATQIATSEVVINGAALEDIDPETDNASVLVATRVTTTDLEGVTKPSFPYRLRVIVHEDEAGNMTGYDLKYPDGGN